MNENRSPDDAPVHHLTYSPLFRVLLSSPLPRTFRRVRCAVVFKTAFVTKHKHTETLHRHAYTIGQNPSTFCHTSSRSCPRFTDVLPTSGGQNSRVSPHESIFRNCGQNRSVNLRFAICNQ